MSEIGKEFQLKTRYRYLEKSAQAQGERQPPLELPYDESQRIINLPDPRKVEEAVRSIREVIERRQSLRRYADKHLALAELSYLLWCTQGVKEATGTVTFRTVPSAGARHALETYLLVNKVEDLEPGLYRFLALKHKLLEVSLEAALKERLTHGCFNQDMVRNSAATFIWAAVTSRMTWRYGSRGYRYLFLDAGHVCQNLYLSAEAVNCGVCAIAAYSDEDVNSLLNLDGEEQFVIYLASVGKRNAP